MLSNTVASISLTANYGALASALKSAMSLVTGFASGAGKKLAHVGGLPSHAPKGKSWLGYAGGQVAGGLAMRGIDMMIDQGKEIFDFNDQLVRFGIAARLGDNSLRHLSQSMRQISNDTGLSALEVLRGARAYVDMAGAAAFTEEKMRLLARVSQATKADIGDLSQVVFQMQKSMKIGDADLEDSLGGVINMSKDGAVHFSQMAQEISELAPQAARYGLVGRKGLNELTAMMQVARTGFSTVSEMGTGITRVFTGLTMHAKQFRQHGVEIFNIGKDGTKTWKNFWEIFDAIRKNNVLGKDPELLRKAFGRSEADRTIRLWMENIGVLRELEDAGLANGVVQKDLDTYTTSAAGRMAIAWEKVKNAIGEALTPERVAMIVAGFETLTQAVGPLIAAVGKVASGIGAVARWSHRQQIERSMNRNLSGDEENLLKALAIDEQKGPGAHYLHPTLKKQALAVREKAKAYNEAMKELTAREDDFGTPSDEALRMAMRYVREDQGDPASIAHSEAGTTYLESRGAGVSRDRMRRIQGDINREGMPTPIDMGPTAALFGKKAAQAFVESMPHLLRVHIDGSPVAAAADNASSIRRR